MSGLVSIIVRTFNRPRLVLEALQSVAAQQYRPIEVVLVNDGGLTPDLDALGKILGDVPLRYVGLEANTGRPAAANAGLRAASGDVIGFLDDDDILLPSHVSLLRRAMEEQKMRVVYSSVRAVLYDENGKRGADGPLYDSDFLASRLLFENFIPLHALLFARSVFDEDVFDETFEFNEDWDLLIRLSRRYTFYHVPEITAEYRLFPKSDDEDRRRVHARWFTRVFDRHRHLVTGGDWQEFYQGYLIPAQEKETDFLKGLLRSEQERLEGLLKGKEEENRVLDAELRKVALEYKDLEARLGRLTKDLQAVSAENERIKTEVSGLRHQLDIIYGSHSWRLTKPLREMGKAFRRIRSLVGYAASHPPSVVCRRAVMEFYRSPMSGPVLGLLPPSVKQRGKAWLVRREAVSEPVLSASDPRISIIIPIYNHADFLPLCLESALGQDYPHVEVVAVDDASTDPRVREILASYADNPRLKVFTNDRNQGIAETQNRALVESSGDIIAFLDCDDYLERDAVSSVLPFWGRETVYLHTARINMDENGREVQRISFEHLPRRDYFAENLERMFATHFKLIRRDVFGRVGLFDPRFDSAQDYDMLMRVAFHYPSSSFAFVPRFVYHHRLHSGQTSSIAEARQQRFTSLIQEEARKRRSISDGTYAKKVSIIMLSYGKGEQTMEALASIAETVRIPMEVILFDNGSDDETVRLLRKEVTAERYPLVRLVLNPENHGPAAGRREAIKYATGDYFITFDNDEIAQPGWLEELIVRAETDPQIGAVVSRVYFPDNRLQFSGGGVIYHDDELVELLRYDVNRPWFELGTAGFRECDWVPIGATLFTVSPGPYLHSGYPNAFEDAGVSFALRRAGYRLVNAPGARVLHNHFLFRGDFGMKKDYLDARYNQRGMMQSLASFYQENGLILYDEYVWKENGLDAITRADLKKRLREIAGEKGNGYPTPPSSVQGTQVSAMEKIGS